MLDTEVGSPLLSAELKQEGLTLWFWFSFPSLSRNGTSHTHSWGPYERVSRFWVAWCIGIREKRNVSSRKLFWVMEMTLGNFQALTWVLFLEVSRVCGLNSRTQVRNTRICLEIFSQLHLYRWEQWAGVSGLRLSCVGWRVDWPADSGWWNPARALCCCLFLPTAPSTLL